jgi:hypothetical protein
MRKTKAGFGVLALLIVSSGCVSPSPEVPAASPQAGTFTVHSSLQNVGDKPFMAWLNVTLPNGTVESYPSTIAGRASWNRSFEFPAGEANRNYTFEVSWYVVSEKLTVGPQTVTPSSFTAGGGAHVDSVQCLSQPVLWINSTAEYRSQVDSPLSFVGMHGIRSMTGVEGCGINEDDE